MELKRVCVCGHFGTGENLLNGQTVKTKIVTNELEKHFGAGEVYKLDTHGGIKALFKLPIQTWKAMRTCKNIIMLPAHNGVRVLTPILLIWNVLFHRKLHYVVIGGWLPKFLKNKRTLTNQLMRFDGIYVETKTMKLALEKAGFHNVVVMPNCKNLDILDESELVYHTSEPYKLCTFSRVMKEKGIEDAVNAVKIVNEKFGRVVYVLDIYGQVDSGQVDWFEKLQKEFPEYVHYKGLVPFDQSVNVLKNYFALLFPTRFYTEGIPGTVIDAYAAGIPVVSAKWESFYDIVDDRSTGIGYEFGSVEKLSKALFEIKECKVDFDKLKLNCLEKSKQYIPSEALKVILGEIE